MKMARVADERVMPKIGARMRYFIEVVVGMFEFIRMLLRRAFILSLVDSNDMKFPISKFLFIELLLDIIYLLLDMDV